MASLRPQGEKLVAICGLTEATYNASDGVPLIMPILPIREGWEGWEGQGAAVHLKPIQKTEFAEEIAGSGNSARGFLPGGVFKENKP